MGGLTPVAELVGVGKRFGATRALHDVSVAFHRGVVHGLVGENGAGKSTLGGVLTGVVAPDEGDVLVSGQAVRLRSPRHALTYGLVGIAQELSLVPARTVLDNVMLGTESTRAGFVDRRAQRVRFAEIEALYGFELDPDAVVRDLNVAAQQRVELLRALGRRADLVVMDEPTARLTTGEAVALRGVIRMLATEGTAIVYVSHFLDEVLAVSDEVTVMRDGRVVRTGPAASQTPESLLEGMVGRTIGSTFPPKVPLPHDAPIRLAVEGLARPGEFGPVSFSVRAGEIVGLAGLVGAGRSELAHAVVGSTKAAAGSVALDGEPLRRPSVRRSIAERLYLIPESRRTQGLVMQRSVRDNVVLPHLRSVTGRGLVSARRERDVARRVCATSTVKAASVDASISSLSGGNQQKVLFARWLVEPPRVLIADEPTRGVDVASKQGIYRLLAELAAGGTAVVLISSELEEILGMSHRVLVMRRGRISAELIGDAITEDRVVAAAFADAPTTVAETPPAVTTATRRALPGEP